MAKHRVNFTHRNLRSILTDMLPFEVPPTFSNRGFYRFLRTNSVQIEGGRIKWVADTDRLDATICLLFGYKGTNPVESETIKEWGKTKAVRSISIGPCRMDTIPFNFKVSHKLDGRTLSVVHPRNQIQVANFYSQHSSIITYYTSLSEFSIRRPVSVSRYAFFKDGLHEKKLDTITGGIEEADREYEQLGSYFVYKKYRNVHRFFESYKYHRCEKKYNSMVQIDVSKCFDSIYTHSLPWSILGKSQTKHWLDQSKSTFGASFDALMQRLNQNETNGIVIGPEFSRIFAEIILQSVDVQLQAYLLKTSGLIHKIDYEIFRYVDDYFVFYNEPSTQLKIFESLQDLLRLKKLSVNTAKIKHYEKPIITEITIAKERISELLNSQIDFETTENVDGEQKTKTLEGVVNSNRLIVLYKAVLKEAGVEYGDLLNYTFAILENKIAKLFRSFNSCDKTEHDRKRFVKSLLAVTEFSFFVYAASPKVNHTIRLSRLISASIEFLNTKGFSHELKHLLFKYIHDNIMQQIEKNTMTLHREIETLYLLIVLSRVGREYWLPESTLLKHFLIDADLDETYWRHDFMNHFSITAIITYMRDKVRYKKLREFIEKHVLLKFKSMEANCQKDAESMILFLDLVVCPYVSDSFKAAIGVIFGLDANGLASLQSSNDHWFTAWGGKFDLGKELDAKRSREVY